MIGRCSPSYLPYPLNVGGVLLCDLCSEPSAAPSNLTVTAVGSDSVTITWTNLDILDWNGEFEHFQITYQSVSTGRNLTISNTTVLTISSLVFGTKYRISVAFVGSGGVGPESSLLVETTHDGEAISSLYAKF